MSLLRCCVTRRATRRRACNEARLERQRQEHELAPVACSGSWSTCRRYRPVGSSPHVPCYCDVGVGHVRRQPGVAGELACHSVASPQAWSARSALRWTRDTHVSRLLMHHEAMCHPWHPSAADVPLRVLPATAGARDAAGAAAVAIGDTRSGRIPWRWLYPVCCGAIRRSMCASNFVATLCGAWTLSAACCVSYVHVASTKLTA